MNSYNLDAAGITLPDKPATTTPAKVRKTRKAASKRTDRTLDPEIIRLRQEHNQRVKEYRGKAHSAKIVATMIKRLSQLTADDKERLVYLLPAVTPPLPLN